MKGCFFVCWQLREEQQAMGRDSVPHHFQIKQIRTQNWDSSTYFVTCVMLRHVTFHLGIISLQATKLVYVVLNSIVMHYFTLECYASLHCVTNCVSDIRHKLLQDRYIDDYNIRYHLKYFHITLHSLHSVAAKCVSNVRQCNSIR